LIVDVVAPIDSLAQKEHKRERRGYGLGLIGNIAVGIVGAVIAGWLLPSIGFVLIGGILAAIVNAVIGAVILLLVIGLIRWAA
jgi:uncharacterized membrane protein YeaQ/YmgE (transglycosylase-associated protein family)